MTIPFGGFTSQEQNVSKTDPFVSTLAGIRRYHVPAALAVAKSANGAHAALAVLDAGGPQQIRTGITQPAVPRTASATAGGTAGDIKAVSVTVYGTNMQDKAISEVLPAFTVNTAGIVNGTKIFKTFTGYDVPAMDGTGATVALGFGDTLGLPDLLEHNTVLVAFLDHVKEGTAPTVTADADEIEKNSFKLNSALDGHDVDVYYIAA